MMKIKFLILIILLFIFSCELNAEISAVKDSNYNFSNLIFMYRDIPNDETWKKFSNNLNRVPLNEYGDLNGDGKPIFAINISNSLPEVIWSKFYANDYEIAYSYFDGLEWSNYELITDNDTDDLDPFITFSKDGIVKITWWSNELIPQVYYKIRKNGNWSSQIRISNQTEKSKFPSIAALDLLSFISYEVPSIPNGKSIYVATGTDDPDPIPLLLSRTVIGSSDFTENSQPTPHILDGHLWVDWIYDENFLCWSEKIGEDWTLQRYEAYSGPDDIPRARLYIKIKVLNGQ